MRIVYNPPNGANIKRIAFKGQTDTTGYYYSLPVGLAGKFRNDVAEFLLTTLTFLKELNQSGQVIYKDGHSVELTEGMETVKLGKIVEFKPTEAVPDRTKPQKKTEEDDNLDSKPDFYGNGLEDDTPDSNWRAPESKFKKKE